MANTRKNVGVLIESLIEMSFSIAVQLNQTTIVTEHLLFALFQNAMISRYFIDKGIDVKAMSKEILGYLESQSQYLRNEIPGTDENTMTGQITAEVAVLLDKAMKRAKLRKEMCDVTDVLIEIFETSTSYASYFMVKYGITEQMIKDMLPALLETKANMRQSNKVSTSGNSLAEFCTNLNEKVKISPSDPLIGRTKELFTIAHTLSKRKRSNILLIGDPGVGKSMIVEGLAQNINAGTVPETLKDKIIYSLDVGTVMAGSKFRGDFEEKIRDILAELVANPKAILFIDEAHQMDAGEGKGQSGLGFSSMLKPELGRGTLKVIASTTWEGYRHTFEKDTALMRRFRTMTVDEPSVSETIEILKGSRESVEEFHKCKIEDSALEAAVELTVKYQPERKLPDKAVDILDSACARMHVIENATNVVDRTSIIQEITEITGITVKSETNSVDAAKFILTLGDRLRTHVFHQDKAVEQVSQSLIIAQSGLKNPQKPIGSFLFVGPSGVGKTFLAKQIANDMNMRFLRYDMSEFQEKHAVARLIGAPPGYIGFGDGGVGEGQLVNDLIKNPNSVILFDEVEKAHPDTFNVFLQLLDEGKITGTTGKVADCRNCVIVMTSNLGSSESKKIELGFGSQKSGKSAYLKAANGFFLTELRGRMTATVEFDELDDLSYRRIVAERINDISKMIRNKNVRIIASEALISHILELNNNSEYGARKIAGIIESLISYPLSVELLNGNIQNNESINLDWVDNKIVINQSKNLVRVEEPVI